MTRTSGFAALQRSTRQDANGAVAVMERYALVAATGTTQQLCARGRHVVEAMKSINRQRDAQNVRRLGECEVRALRKLLVRLMEQRDRS